MLLGQPNLLTSACKSNGAFKQANHDFASEIEAKPSIEQLGFSASHWKSALQKFSTYGFFPAL
jgi:hypothetical protein